MGTPTFSFVVPVYNRPEEMGELLNSFARQPVKNFEVIVVEDGSQRKSDGVVQQYAGQLDLTYIFQPNAGPGAARNHGASHAKGSYLLFLDSDVILPADYLRELDSLEQAPAFFGGPDRAAADFSATQKAINYSMTSFLTTGGIRGKKGSLEAYKPRSFNMGMKKALFDQVGGFRDMRFGEDIDLSLRVEATGTKGVLLENAWVYHKRRSTFGQFYKQVFNSGIARIHLHLLHPGSIKLVHTFPSLFTLGFFGLLGLSAVFSPWWLIPPALFALTIAGHATMGSGLGAGVLAVPASFVQLFGYGLGFLKAGWEVWVLRRKPVFSFTQNFYK